MSLTYTRFLTDPSFTHARTFRDPLWKDISIPAYLAEVVRTPSFIKLGRIKQLGVAFHLYPGAVHTRLSHSLGVFHLSGLLIASLLRRKADGGLLSIDGIRHFLAATLLHDIGHFPFTHSLKELPLRSHEQLATKLLEDDRILATALQDAALDAKTIGDIIDEDRPTSDGEVLLYRSILSGALDPDKLDYLNRDAYFAGVPYGIQDVSYITDHLHLHERELALGIEALGSVEHLLFSKYLMYRNVYWHTSVRSATAMIKRYLHENLNRGTLDEEQLYGLDDESFFLLSRTERPLGNLLDRVRENRLFRPVVEELFDEKDPIHTAALDLDRRSEYEKRIEQTLNLPSGSIVIDIPERVSFESDIPIVHNQTFLGKFEDVDPLFTRSRALEFTSSLRTVRLFSNPTIDPKALIHTWRNLHG
ncbi:MAG: HD domain-containing protein [Spirochaetales bacterium]|nr:HD domain-containing protein [Spirochaetales bacterium]